MLSSLPSPPSRGRRSFVLASAAALAAAVLPGCGGGDDEALPATSDSPELQRVADEAVRSGLVGIVVNHMTLDRRRQQAAGLRKLGTDDRLRQGDRFMHGSTTKAMASLVAARLVERGLIAWTTTLAQALPDLAPAMRAAYRGVTLEQLLGHRGGVMAFDNPADVSTFQEYLPNDAADEPATLAGRQRFFAAWLLAQPSPGGRVPGRDFLYSNAGYGLAAMMLEARSGHPYPLLFEQELNQPLAVGLRWQPADEAPRDRPWGHAGPLGQVAALPPEDSRLARWIEVLRPAGADASVTTEGYARWVRWHMLALQGRPTPLPDTYVRRLRTLQEGDYALGWIAQKINGRPVLTHDGAYAGFFSLVVLDTAGRSASFAFTNTGGEDQIWPLQRLNVAVLETERLFSPRSSAPAA